MKIYFTTQAEAQAAANAAHEYLIANDAAYSDSVKAGQTTCWDTPVKDDQGWGIIIEERVALAFRITAEVAK